MVDAPHASSPSPWHQGERRIQERLGVADRMEVFGRKVIRDYLPDEYRAFFGQLPFLAVGAVDETGAPWATLLDGAPGFVSSPDPRTLRIGGSPGIDDPLRAAIVTGAPVGLLGIELHTRRRNRMNGHVAACDREGFAVTVEHAFGNCPQYIQTRAVSFVRVPEAPPDRLVVRAPALDETARALIAAADTFFVASYLDVDDVRTRRAVDVSHRGGKPGFVRIDGAVLTIPDFAGNLHFNTLGNLLLNPRAGLVFVDFARGDLLQLTGTTEIVFEGEEIAAFQGAERLWRFKVEQIVWRRAALALRGTFGEYSPNSLLTGSWEEAAARREAAALRRSWRPFRVARIVEESTSIRSFHLEPADGAGLPMFEAGQHLPIRLQPSANTPPVIRTYTLSVAPSDGAFRISVKRDGIASQFLHDRVSVGDLLDARAPEGGFTVDAGARRPLVLLSAGVGITPMLAMLRHVVYEGLRTRRVRPTWFIHASRTKHERPFDAELAELAAQGHGGIEVVRVLSQPEDSAAPGSDYEQRGRIDAQLLKAALPFDDYDFYLCGPAAFTQGLYDQLRDLRIPDDRIHAEAFGPSALVRRPDPGMGSAAPAFAPAATQAVHVVFAKSAKEARWTPGSGSLLELAEARGLTPEFSCRGGTCGTCRTEVLEGQVTYLSPPNAAVGPAEGLICCAVPAAGEDPDRRLVLDL